MNSIVSRAPKRPLKIMQVLPRLEVGGVERGTIDWAIHLKAMGHHPIVVSGGGRLVDQLQAHQITHITLNVGEKSLITLKSIKKLRSLIESHEVDLVHARSRLPAWLCWWAMKVKKRSISKRPAFVTTLHGLHSVSRYSSIMARGDRVIAVSQAAKVYLLNHFSRWLKHDPVVVHRGIDGSFDRGSADLTWFSSQWPDLKAKQKVLLPGRLTHVKGADQMITWLRQASDRQCLLLTADPDESAHSRRIHDLIVQNQVQDKVVWLGVQRRMRDLYAAVDVVVSVNNKPESFGRTVLEALTMGTPVVAYSQGGVTEIMDVMFPDGKIPPGDQTSLGERINAFCAQAPQVRPSDAFSLRQQFEQTWSVYQSLLGGGS